MQQRVTQLHIYHVHNCVYEHALYIYIYIVPFWVLGKITFPFHRQAIFFVSFRGGKNLETFWSNMGGNTDFWKMWSLRWTGTTLW